MFYGYNGEAVFVKRPSPRGPAAEQKRRIVASDKFVGCSRSFVEVRQKRIRVLKRVASVQIIAA
jgi:hypothetical protein